MNSIKKISSLPVQRMVSTIYSRSVGNRVEDLCKDNFESIIQVNSPEELKNSFGFDKCFVETRGNEILAVAATKKLLMEEKLRQSLLSLNTPLHKIGECCPPKSHLSSVSVMEDV